MNFTNTRRAFVAGIIVIVLIGVAGCGTVATAQKTEDPADNIPITAYEPDGMTKPAENTGFPGMTSLLDGWTYANNFGEDDSRVDYRLDLHGARAAESGEVPDIRLDATTKDGERILWVRYHGQERFVSENSPDWNVEIRKLVLDMARIRIDELREQIDKQLATK